jgi:hypothetical protein
MLEALRASGIRRPVLTAYLPPYQPSHPASRGRMPYKINPLQRENGVLTRLTGFPIRHWRSLDQPVAADFLSLHFALADGRFNGDVPMDPAITSSATRYSPAHARSRRATASFTRTESLAGTPTTGRSE